MECPNCSGERLHRRRRTLAEKLIFATIYECSDCGRQYRVPHFQRGPRWSLIAACPRCGNRDLKAFSRRDHIEGYYTNPFSTLQRFFGARLLYCKWCRLQFYDLRRRQGADDPDAR